MPSLAANKKAGTVTAGLAALLIVVGTGADARHPAVEWANRQARAALHSAAAFYARTPADERVTWGGLAACAVLGLGVGVERAFRLRWSRVVPKSYSGRFHERFVEGKLDRGKALDFCELNPSPITRVVLAAVRRWGRPVSDLERGLALARQVEIDRLRRNVGTLRRIAVLAPLIGLLGTLMAAHRGLLAPGEAVAPMVARSLAALTAGVGLAILSLVAYDGLMGRVEALASTLDRLGAEALDAIAMHTPIEPRPSSAGATHARASKVRAELPSHRPLPHSGMSRSEIPLEAD